MATRIVGMMEMGNIAPTAGLEPTLNKLLSKLNDWCETNQITMNAKKSKSVIFSHRVTDQEQIDCLLGGQILEKVNHYIYLRFELDSQLSYHLCITKIIQRINNIKYGSLLKLENI